MVRKLQDMSFVRSHNQWDNFSNFKKVIFLCNSLFSNAGQQVKRSIKDSYISLYLSPVTVNYNNAIT